MWVGGRGKLCSAVKEEGAGEEEEGEGMNGEIRGLGGGGDA